MRTVPCRVACYYKFNVKSWSEEMREGGLGIRNGSIHLPFSVGQQMRSKGKGGGRKGASGEKLIVKERNHFTAGHVAAKPISPFGLAQAVMLGLCLLHSSVKIWKSDHSFRFTFLLPAHSHLQMHFSPSVICDESSCVITDKVFHSLSVFLHCCYVSVSVKRTTPERGHCSGSRCQWRRGHSWD